MRILIFRNLTSLFSEMLHSYFPKTRIVICRSQTSDEVSSAFMKAKEKFELDKITNEKNDSVFDSTLVKVRRSYFLNDKKINGSQLVALYNSCPQALDKYYNAKATRGTGRILTFGGLLYAGGSFLYITFSSMNEASIGHRSNDVGQRVLKNAGLGLGLSVIGMICLHSVPGRYQDAVNYYNNRHKNPNPVAAQFSFVVDSNGVGVRMTF